jgi:hypothetical protein
MMMKTKNWSPKFIALAVVCLLVSIGIGLVGYHYLFKSIEPTEPTKKAELIFVVEKIILYENGKQSSMVLNLEEPPTLSTKIASLLTSKLPEINLQARCFFGEEDIQEIKQNDRVIELIFKIPTDITISQWVEPEERYHIPVDEKGNRILRNVKTALFVLEDKQDKGLEAHILVGHLIPPKMGSGHEKEWISYSCWAININPEGKPELDKTWIDTINWLFGRAS